MSTYSINELSQLSGIKPHTLRIWEQRYGLLNPHRTETNIRYYDDEQLKKLVSICELIKSGMKISHIGKLTDAEIASHMDAIIAASFKNGDHFESILNQLIVALSSFDEVLFEKIFSNSILRFGMVKTYVNVIYPLLMKVGLMWAKNDVMPAQEHFVSYLIMQKLFASIDSLPLPPNSNQTWVLFLNEGEEHEIGLLFANYIIRQHGKRVIYLGSNVPVENVVSVLKQTKATHVYTFFVKRHKDGHALNLLNKLMMDLKKTKLFVSGNESFIESLDLNKQVKWIREIDTLLKLVQS
jgi:DNA-binding transcriptional MerR regulator